MSATHKLAKDLDVLDNFSMAAGEYTISYIYETNDDTVVKFAFHSRLDPSVRKSTMTVPNDLMFFVT